MYSRVLPGSAGVPPAPEAREIEESAGETAALLGVAPKGRCAPFFVARQKLREDPSIGCERRLDQGGMDAGFIDYGGGEELEERSCKLE